MSTPQTMYVKPRNRREAKLQRDEEELQALIEKEQKAKAGEVEEDEEETEEEVTGEEQKTSEQEEEEVQPDEEKEKEPLTDEEKTFKKRYGDLRAHAAKQKKELEAKIKELEDKVESSSVEPPKDHDEIVAWKEKYPDFSRFVENLADQIAEKKFKDAKISIEQLNKDREESRQEKARQEIRKVHKDFDEIQQSDEFHDWAEGQPKWVQDALFENSDDAKSVIRVLDLYRIDHPTKKPKKDTTKAASDVNVKNTRTSVDVKANKAKFKESQVARMSDKEYAAKAEEIDKAIRSGEFIYDISGSAR